MLDPFSSFVTRTGNTWSRFLDFVEHEAFTLLVSVILVQSTFPAGTDWELPPEARVDLKTDVALPCSSGGCNKE